MTSKRRRIGIMGGTFDPVHNGHLVAASEVQVSLDLDEVIFVPTGKPADKPNVSQAEHRYLMTVIATGSNPRFRVSRVDVDRPGFTYTIDTLRDIRKELPNADLFFITGADAIAAVQSWKESDELMSLAHFVGVSRPGHEFSLALVPDDRAMLIEVPALAISSSDCRARVFEGSSIWYLVPDGVVQYIAKHRLYREPN